MKPSLTTGFRPGGVCPYGVDNIPIFIDESLSTWEYIYPAAGTNSTGSSHYLRAAHCDDGRAGL